MHCVRYMNGRATSASYLLNTYLLTYLGTGEWAGYQCVCELGAELLPAYSRSMLSSRQARDRAAKRLRKYVVTLFSMALGLPLLLDKRLLHLGQWMVSS